VQVSAGVGGAAEQGDGEGVGGGGFVGVEEAVNMTSLVDLGQGFRGRWLWEGERGGGRLGDGVTKSMGGEKKTGRKGETKWGMIGNEGENETYAFDCIMW
jgi:hypothetical protein